MWNPNKRCNQSLGPAAAEVCLKSRVVIFQSEQDPVLPPDPGATAGMFVTNQALQVFETAKGPRELPRLGCNIVLTGEPSLPCPQALRPLLWFSEHSRSPKLPWNLNLRFQGQTRPSAPVWHASKQDPSVLLQFMPR